MAKRPKSPTFSALKGVVLHYARHSSGEVVLTYCGKYRGKEYVDIRLWHSVGGGEFRATKRGLRFYGDEIDLLLRSARKVRKHRANDEGPS